MRAARFAALCAAAAAAAAACPSQGACGCDWTHGGTACHGDDGTECWCRCCCQYTGSCKWQPPAPPGPSPPAPPTPPTPPPSPPEPGCKTDAVAGVLSVQDGGKQRDVYIITQKAPTSGVKVSGASVTCPHGARLYFGSRCVSAIEPDGFWQMPMLGRTLSYTVDLSQVGCASNSALYTVSMPAVDSSGRPAKTKCNDYYCDANQVCGVWCPEMDIQEANTAAWATTPHSCTGKGPYYPSCDKGGNGHKVRDDVGYGSGKSAIDTSRPFRVSMTFVGAAAAGFNATLSKITTRFTQDGMPGLSLDNTNAGYLQNMAAALAAGQVVTISNWGGTSGGMGWLDVPPCGSSEVGPQGPFTVSDFSIA
eukprot:TRINITY_DN962_c4_g1_i1.p1 TRINITY_DN962_c4_g1~~TRINITY_DN962_c4_g1_i1.p1  ORF type:complete len:390 (+),score=99.83 TRINITY_DN962_c4_g1_i1:81-1172(+)